MPYTVLSCIESKIIHPTKFYGKFEIGTFSPGQSLTVANTLRRCLLSELPGTAIALVQISGVSHEYQTLNGVRECVLDIILNLKQIILKSDFDFYTPQIGFLHVKGPGTIRAQDLKLPFFIYSIDPNQYIATLTSNGQLNMRFLITCGKTYLTHTPNSAHYNKWVHLLQTHKPNSFLFSSQKDEKAHQLKPKTKTFTKMYQQWKKKRQNAFIKKPKMVEQNKQKNNTDISTTLTTDKKKDLLMNTTKDQTLKQPISNRSYFPIDAIFSPIIRVNYTIELKNPLTKQEIICLELWTNGTIHPRSAIHKTVKAFIQVFLPLQQKNNLFLKQKKLTTSLTHVHKTHQTDNTFSTLNDGIYLKQLNNPHLLNQITVKEEDSLQSKPTQTPTKYNPPSDVYFNETKFLEIDIMNLNLSFQLYCHLKKANLHKIKHIMTKSKKQLLNLHIDSKGLLELETKLKQYNFFLN